MSRKRREVDFVPIKAEGTTVLLTGFGYVRVKKATEKWFQNYHTRSDLKPKTIESRADASLIATACFLSEKHWRDGTQLEEI
jgi:hypothetical protein